MFFILKIFVRASDHSRSIQSASAFVSGLYPHYPKDQTADYVPELTFVPIPIYSFNAEVDKVNRPIPNCKRLVQIQDKTIVKSIQGNRLRVENAEFLERISNLTGQEINIHNVFQIADYIEAAVSLNRYGQVGLLETNKFDTSGLAQQILQSKQGD
jgi:hypothetical protein